MDQKIEILIAGKPVRQIAHEGKLFVIATEGQEYSIRLKNNSTSRVTGVISVDGINVISGEPAVPKGGGYIINGNGSYTVRGFRTSDEEVHPFVFNKKAESYAAKSDNGSIEDAGVIGVVFWGEKHKPIPTYRQQVIEKHIHHDHYHPYWYPRPSYPYYHTTPFWLGGSTSGYADQSYTLTSSGGGGTYSCASNNISNSASVLRSAIPTTYTPNDINNVGSVASKSLAFDMGTQFSDKAVSDSVATVDFEWGRNLGTIKIYYASREVLKAMGVPVDQAKAVTFPEPFRPQGYCRPPHNN